MSTMRAAHRGCFDTSHCDWAGTLSQMRCQCAQGVPSIAGVSP